MVVYSANAGGRVQAKAEPGANALGVEPKDFNDLPRFDMVLRHKFHISSQIMGHFVDKKIVALSPNEIEFAEANEFDLAFEAITEKPSLEQLIFDARLLDKD